MTPSTMGELADLNAPLGHLTYFVNFKISAAWTASSLLAAAILLPEKEKAEIRSKAKIKRVFEIEEWLFMLVPLSIDAPVA
jgi:hypothetical protein